MQELEFYTTVEALAFPGIYGTFYEGLKRILLNTPHTGIKLEFEAFHTVARSHKSLLRPAAIPRSYSMFQSNMGEDVMCIPLLNKTPLSVPVYGNRWLQIADEWFTPHTEDWVVAWFSDLRQVEGQVFKSLLWHTSAGNKEPPNGNIRRLLFAEFGDKEAVLDGWAVQPLEDLLTYAGGVSAFRLRRGTRSVYFTDESLDEDYHKYCVFAPCREDLVAFLANWDLQHTDVFNNAVVYQRV